MMKSVQHTMHAVRILVMYKINDESNDPNIEYPKATFTCCCDYPPPTAITQDLPDRYIYG